MSESPNIALAAWLLQQNITTDVIDNKGNTALSLAVERGHVELVRLLMKASVSLEFNHEHAFTLLHLSTYHGHLALVKYFIEEAHLSITTTKQFKNPLDIAIERNHTDIVAYIRALLIKEFQDNQETMRAQLIHHFSTLAQEAQEPLQELQDALHLPSHVLTPETLANRWISGMHSFLQGNYPRGTATSSSASGSSGNPVSDDIYRKADELARGIIEGIKQNEHQLSPAQREEFRQITVESLRPYTIQAVKHIEAQIAERERIERIFMTDVTNPANEPNIEPDEEGQQGDSQITSSEELSISTEEEEVPKYVETAYVVPSKYYFIPNYRAGNVSRIKRNVQELRDSSNEDTTDTLTDLAEDIQDTFDDIKQEQAELTTLYRNMKANISKRGGDSIFFTQDTSQFNPPQMEAFQQEVKILQQYIDHVAQAQKLLLELQELKNELCQIIAVKRIKGVGYITNSHLSNFENDYSDEALSTYLKNCGRGAYADREKHFIALLCNKCHSSFENIMQRLGQPEPVSKQDFVDLLHATAPFDAIISALNFRVTQKTLPFVDRFKYFSKISLQIINQSPTLPICKTAESMALLAGIISTCHFHYQIQSTVEERIAYITPIILEAIIQAAPHPFSKTMQLTSMLEIKKRIHKLTWAIGKKLQQPTLMLTDGNSSIES